MTCADFERGWNELLDARTNAAGELERSLREHAADCPACRPLAARYQLLRRALDAWDHRPAAPVDLADRILTAAGKPAASRAASGMRRARPIWRIGLPLATAAAAAIALIFARPTLDGPRPIQRTRQPLAAEAGTRALNHALADATEATWDLARSTSEPAARIGRQVFDAATGTGTTGADDEGSFSVSSYVPSAPDSIDASAMLRQVGDSFATTVGPLSTTAKHAFGFLLGPPPAKPEARRITPDAKGA
jgi:hypothetical protein